MTKRDFFEAVVKTDVSEELINAANDFLKALDETNAKRKQTVNSKKLAENAPLIKAIKEYLTGKNDYVPASEVASAVGINTSKATPLLKSIDGIAITDIKHDKRTVKGYKLG